jgi:hypothetical protein
MAIHAASMFFFLAVGAVSLFTFFGVAAWIAARKEERIALYRTELLKKVAEQPSDGARQVLELLHEERARKELEKRRGLLFAGMLIIAVGIGLTVLLAALPTGVTVWPVGLIPVLIGAAFLLFGWLGMRPRPASPWTASATGGDPGQGPS